MLGFEGWDSNPEVSVFGQRVSDTDSGGYFDDVKKVEKACILDWGRMMETGKVSCPGSLPI